MCKEIRASPVNDTYPRDAGRRSHAQDEYMRRQDVRLRLKREKNGIREFQIEGLAACQFASACWNGRVLVVTKYLYDLLLLSRAIEGIFADHEYQEPVVLCDHSQCRIAVEILRCLDHVNRVDYEMADHAHCAPFV